MQHEHAGRRRGSQLTSITPWEMWNNSTVYSREGRGRKCNFLRNYDLVECVCPLGNR